MTVDEIDDVSFAIIMMPMPMPMLMLMMMMRLQQLSNVP